MRAPSPSCRADPASYRSSKCVSNTLAEYEYFVLVVIVKVQESQGLQVFYG